MGLESEPAGREEERQSAGTTLGGVLGAQQVRRSQTASSSPFPLCSIVKTVPVVKFSTSSGTWAPKAAGGFVSSTAQWVREKSLANHQSGVLVSF